MEQDPSLEKSAFSFIRVAPRASKPRETGLNIVVDRGMGMNQANDLLEAAGQHIDFFKLGMGSYHLQSEELIRRKLKAYRAAGIRSFFAGDVLEAAFLQGVSKHVYQTVKDLGADAVEVSSAQVSMSLKDKCELIRMANASGLKVVAELGQKGNECWTESPAYAIAQVKAYFSAGAWKVLVQGEGVNEGVESPRNEFVLRLGAEFDRKDFIFQAKESRAQEWYIATFGNDVNLDLYDHQIIEVELMRRGIRKRGLFGLVGSMKPADNQ